MKKKRGAMSSRRKKIVWILGVAAIGFVAVLIILSVVISRRAHIWAADWMSEQYHSQVQLDAFRVTIPFPLVQCEGDNLVLHFQGRQDLPPLIAVTRFTMRTSVLGLLRRSRRIEYLKLEGLQINVPPRGDANPGPFSGLKKKFRAVRLDQIISENAVLRILTNKPGKDPLEFSI